MDKTVFTYDEKLNPDGAYLAGVPLRDLTESEFVTLPEWLQRSVEACPFYVRVKTRVTGRETAVKDGE